MDRNQPSNGTNTAQQLQRLAGAGGKDSLSGREIATQTEVPADMRAVFKAEVKQPPATIPTATYQSYIPQLHTTATYQSYIPQLHTTAHNPPQLITRHDTAWQSMTRHATLQRHATA